MVLDKKTIESTLFRTEQNDDITHSESNTFYQIKAFAILSVIAAHLNQINSISTGMKIAGIVWEIYARTGVVCFFILSGFFFKGFTPSFSEFWRKKFKGLIIPWLICGVCTYLLSCFLGKQFDFIDMLKWIGGYGTWLYYVVVLLALYLIFGFARNNGWLYIAIVLTILSIILHDIIGENSMEYLNVWNWSGFFALGSIIRNKRFDRRLTMSNKLVFFSAIMFTVGALITVATKRFGYFHMASLIYEVAAFPLMLKACSIINKASANIRRCLCFVGKQTLFIYLVHMQIVQAIGTRISEGMLKTIFYPIGAFIIMSILTWGICLTASKVNFIKRTVPYIGIKL